MATRFTQSLSDLMTDLADYRMLSLSQFAHLHFGGKRAARRRMQQLLDEGLVELLAGAPAQRGGRPENVYGLAKAGLQLLKSDKALDERLTLEQVGGGNLGHQAAHQLLLGARPDYIEPGRVQPFGDFLADVRLECAPIRLAHLHRIGGF